jgi:hypothetical protein
VLNDFAFSKVEQGAGKSFGLLFIRSNSLRISTVVFCIFALVVLAMSGELSEGAVAVISSIAGFVLGGVPKETSEQKGTGNGNS